MQHYGDFAPQNIHADIHSYGCACLQLLCNDEGILQLLNYVLEPLFPHHSVLDKHSLQIAPWHLLLPPELPPWLLPCMHIDLSIYRDIVCHAHVMPALQ